MSLLMLRRVLSVTTLVSLLLLTERVIAVDLHTSCAEPGAWTLVTELISSGETEEYAVRLACPTSSTPPRFTVSFDVPQLDAIHKWTSEVTDPRMPPNWRCTTESRLCKGLPLVDVLNGNDRSRLCVAVSEAKRTVRMSAGLREEDCRIVWKLDFFTESEAPLSAYEVRIRVDSRNVFFGDAIADGVSWIECRSSGHPVEPPESAFDPIYSSWYSFHQNVFDRDIEAECAEAAKLGMRTIIVDDGWQTDDTNRGYAYTGDWEVSKRRFPNMANHVANVHALGMKYMIWYGVPMMGYKAKNYDRFKGKYLWNDSGDSYSCLDPRFPEVRNYLCEIYEQAVRDWHIDGLKLDFIDEFGFRDADPAIAENYVGRDIKSVPEAVDMLLAEIKSRLTRINPDFLLEFRQSYIGPGIRRYGNMLRAMDCPGDLHSNRFRIANLRLTSGRTAVHSDMLEWNTDDSPENAARFVLSAIYSTIQYSVMLRDVPDAHRRMIEHWLRFSQCHRSALLKGAFRPHHFEANYPWIESEDGVERIASAYVDGTVIPVDVEKKTNFVLNGTGVGRLYLDLASPATALLYNTYGECQKTVRLDRGPVCLAVSVSGFLKLVR